MVKPVPIADSTDPCPACGGVTFRNSLPGLRDRQGEADGRFTVLCCVDCGSGLTAPRVSEQDLGRFYGSQYGPHNAGKLTRIMARLVMEVRLRTRSFRALPRDRGAVVDFGSGRGDLLRALGARGWEICGVEPSADAAASATESGVPTLVSVPGEAPLRTNSFDAAIFHHSLEHTTEPLESLIAARSALKPGGVILITVPNFGSLAAHRLGDDWWALDVPRHRTHFTKKGLGEILERAGFREVQVNEVASYLGPVANLHERLSGRFEGVGLFFLASYALALLSYPFAWSSNELRGGGEFLVASGIH